MITPRPLYRWKSFWLGVLVLCFLGWAWSTSITSRPKWHWLMSAHLGVFQENGAVGAWGLQAMPFGGPGFDGWQTPVVLPPQGLVFRSAWRIESLERNWRIVASYWFLILLFLVPWSAWLAWRWKRLRKLHRATTQR